MKLRRQRRRNDTLTPTIQLAGAYHDASGEVLDFDPVFFASGELERLAQADIASWPSVDDFDSYAPCVAKPPKIVCIGLHYHGHAREADMDVPTEAVIFSKSPSFLSGTNDPILLPPEAEMLDWEIKTWSSGAPQSACPGCALDHVHVAGYMLPNDVSKRHYHRDYKKNRESKLHAVGCLRRF